MKKILIACCILAIVFSCEEETVNQPEKSSVEIITQEDDGGATVEKRVNQITVTKGDFVTFAVRQAEAQYLSILFQGTAAEGEPGLEIGKASFTERTVDGEEVMEAQVRYQYNKPGTFEPLVVTTNSSYPSTKEIKRVYSESVRVVVED